MGGTTRKTKSKKKKILKSPTKTKEIIDFRKEANYIPEIGRQSFPTRDLIERLRILEKYFSDVPQSDDECIKWYKTSKLGKELLVRLLQPALLNHSNGSVRILLGCILVDLFRINAPELPWENSNDLESIFSFFISTISLLNSSIENSNSKNGLNGGVISQRLFFFVEKLAVLKIFIILFELENSSLALELFSTILDLFSSRVVIDSKDKEASFSLFSGASMKSESISVMETKLQVYLMDILLLYLEELQGVPSVEILECLMDGIKAKYGSPKSKMMEKLIHKSSPRVQDYFAQYLMVILSTESSSKDSGVYELIYNASRFSEKLLIHCMSVLEKELVNPDVEQRMYIVQLMGRIFGKPGTELPKVHRKAFQAFIRRFNDTNEKVREAMCEFAKFFFVNHSSFCRESVSKCLILRTQDSEEKVRRVACSAIANIALESTQFITDELLNAFVIRLKDKKPSVRRDTMKSACMVYYALIVQDPNLIDEETMGKVAILATMVVGSYTVPGITTSEKLSIDSFLEHHLLISREGTNTSLRVDSLDFLFSFMNDNTKSAFGKLLQDRIVARNACKAILNDIDSSGQFLEKFGTQFRDPKKTFDIINNLFKNNRDRYVLSDIKSCMNVENEYDSVNEAHRSVLARLKVTKSSGAVSEITRVFINKISASICSVPIFKDLLERKSLDLLLFLCNNCSQDVLVGFQKTLGSQLIIILMEIIESSHDKKTLFNCIGILKCIVNVIDCKNILKEISTDKKNDLLTLLFNSIFETNSKELVDLAIKVLSHFWPAKDEEGKEIWENIMNEILECFKDSSDKRYLNCLWILTSVVSLQDVYLWGLINKNYSKISETVVKVWTNDDFYNFIDEDLGNNWKNVSFNAQLRANGLEFLQNHLLGSIKVVKGGASSVVKMAKPVLNMLFSIIRSQGDLNRLGSNDEYRIREYEHARLNSALGVLNLATIKEFDQLIGPQEFILISWTCQDESPEVREGFESKLFDNLSQFKNSSRFAALFPLWAIDPEKDVEKLSGSHFRVVMTRLRMLLRREQSRRPNLEANARFAMMPESVFFWVLFLVSHHVDYDLDLNQSGLEDSQKYLRFFLEGLHATEGNMGLIRQMLDLIRLQLHDAVSKNSQPLFQICELSTRLLNDSVRNRGWKIHSFPGEIIFPKALFIRRSEMVKVPKLSSHSSSLKSQNTSISSISSLSSNTSKSSKLRTKKRERITSESTNKETLDTLSTSLESVQTISSPMKRLRKSIQED